MGIIHTAYRFDKNQFVSRMVSLNASGSSLCPSLRAVAEESLKTLNDSGRSFLEAICFDDEWVQVPTDDTNRFQELFLVCLAGSLQNSHHSISQASFAVCEALTPNLLLPDGKTPLILTGRPFKELMEQQSLLHLAENFNRVCPSWLSLADARAAESVLSECERNWMPPSADLKKQIRWSPGTAEDLLARMFDELKARCKFATTTASDLVLVNDVVTYH
jgi:hypothetical protein